MTDYSAARIHMVDSQIHTMGVVNENVLNAFRTVPREQFVPEGKQGVAYNDEDMPIAQGRVLMEPVTHARLLQAAAPVSTDSVLDLGVGTGYSSAILAPLVSRLVAVEPDAALLAKAEKLWSSLGYGKITAQQGDIGNGCAGHGPYNLILINGSVTVPPQSLLSQLAPQGRLLAIVRGSSDKIGKAVMFQKNSQGALSERILFDASVPYLPGFEPRNEFVF